MKNRPSPIAYPTTDENARLWGFDIIEPVGRPMAWIHDWTSAQAGWNRPMRGMMDLGALLGSIGSDLSTLKVDDVMAAFCLMYRKDVFGLIEEIETAVDRETAMKIARSYGIKAGSLGWMSTQGQHGAPVPLDKIERIDLSDLLAYRKFLEAVREWPFDTPSMLRFALYLAIPLGSWLGGAFVERLLAAALD